MALQETDIPFARAGDVTLEARIYQDDELARGHAIVSVHGGAWNRNDRTSAHVLDRGLARAGLTVFALDFRQGPNFKFPAATQDIVAGIRYARANAGAYGINPDTIGIVGTSSGGHSVLLTSLTANAAMHEGTTVLDTNGEPSHATEVSNDVAYALSLWPVSNPGYRYNYAKRVNREDLLYGHHAYFDSEADMQKASIQRFLDEGETTSAPPLWLVQPGADDNVPQEMTADLLRALQAKGVPFEYTFYPGEPHALTREDSPAAATCIADAVGFINRQLARR